MRHLIVVLAVALACASAIAADAKKEPIVADGRAVKSRYTGLSFLDEPVVVDREALRATAYEQVLRGLKHLSNWSDYKELKAHKAIAIAYSVDASGVWPESTNHQLSVYVSRWGGGWEYDSAEEARDAALRNCGRYCLVFLLNDQVLGLDQIVDKYLEDRSRRLKELKDRVSRAQQLVLVEDVQKRMATAGTSSYSASPILPLSLGYPDHQQDYQSVCKGRVFYTLRPVPAHLRLAMISKLNRMEKSGLYGPYRRAVSTPDTNHTSHRNPAPGRKTTRQMSFIAVVRDPAELRPLPANLARDLASERIVTVWAEGSARTTGSGIPLDVDPLLRPVAIETSRGLYEGIEMWLPDPGGGCLVTMSFGRAAIRFGIAANDRAAANALLSDILGNVAAELKTDPLLATPVQNEPFAPGEFAMIRLDQPSRVLGGSTFERSAYMVTAWVSEKDEPLGGLYGRENFQGVGSESLTGTRLQLFLKVKHSLTRAANHLGEYRDPSRQEAERYDAIVRARIEAAVARTCTTFKGEVAQDICTIPLVRSPK